MIILITVLGPPFTHFKKTALLPPSTLNGPLTTVMCAVTREWPCSSARCHFISVPHKTENTYTLSCVPFITQKSQLLRTASLSLGVVGHTCNPSTQEDHEYRASRSCSRVKHYLRIKAQRWRSFKTPSHSSGSIHTFAYLCRGRAMHSSGKMPEISQQLLPLGSKGRDQSVQQVRQS